MRQQNLWLKLVVSVVLATALIVPTLAQRGRSGMGRSGGMGGGYSRPSSGSSSGSYNRSSTTTRSYNGGTSGGGMGRSGSVGNSTFGGRGTSRPSTTTSAPPSRQYNGSVSRTWTSNRTYRIGSYARGSYNSVYYNGATVWVYADGSYAYPYGPVVGYMDVGPGYYSPYGRGYGYGGGLFGLGWAMCCGFSVFGLLGFFWLISLFRGRGPRINRY